MQRITLNRFSGTGVDGLVGGGWKDNGSWKGFLFCFEGDDESTTTVDAVDDLR